MSYQCDQNILYVSFSLKRIPSSSLPPSFISVIVHLNSLPKAHHALFIAAKPLKSCLNLGLLHHYALMKITSECLLKLRNIKSRILSSSRLTAKKIKNKNKKTKSTKKRPKNRNICSIYSFLQKLTTLPTMTVKLSDLSGYI